MIVLVKYKTKAKAFVEPLKEVWQTGCGKLYMEDNTGGIRETSLYELSEISEEDILYRFTNGWLVTTNL